MIIFGSLPQSFAQQAYAQVVQLIWVGFLGVVFAFLIPQISSQGLLGKGVFFSMVSGLLSYAVPVLFQLPELTVWIYPPSSTIT